MTKCTFCNKKREWAKKWARVAYERARGVITGAAASGDEADKRSAGPTDREQRSVD